MWYKPIKLCFLLIPFFLLILSGCKCRNDECPAPMAFQFEVIDQEGKNLVGYNPRIYSMPFLSDSVQVFGLTPNQEWEVMNLYLKESVLSFLLDYDVRSYRIVYSFGEDDTLFFEMEEYSDECCDLIVTDFTVWINDTLQPTMRYDSAYVFIK